MTENGFIKLHRKFREWEWSSKPKMVALFIHLLLSANYESSRFQGHEIPRGSLVAGLLALSEATGISFQSLRTCLEKLKQTGEITVKSTNHFSIISVCNYERYQSREIEINKPITNDQQTDNKRITTSEELKKLRKEENNTKPINPAHRECSELLKSRILERRQQKIDDGTFVDWDKSVRLMVEKEHRTTDDIKTLINECHDMPPRSNGFTWADQIRSMGKLRQHWNDGKIFIGMTQKNEKQDQPFKWSDLKEVSFPRPEGAL